jgi:hypothetical protein
MWQSRDRDKERQIIISQIIKKDLEVLPVDLSISKTIHMYLVNV